MALTLEQEIEIAAIEGAQAFVNAEQAQVEAIITAVENGVLALLANGLKNLAAQKVGGILGPEVQLIEGAAATYFEAQAQALLAKYGATVVYQFVQHELAIALAAAQKG